MENKLILTFDAETDGLYGDVFAIGGAVMDADGQVLDTFAGQAESERVTSPWVRENCLPHLSGLPILATRALLQEAFWAFYMRWRERCVVLADVPYPVEAGLLRRCVEKNLPEREWLGPFPLLDLASVLYAKGIDPDINRMEFCGWQGRPHSPLDDAIASGKCFARVMQGVYTDK